MSETLDSNKCFIFIKGLKLINYCVRWFEILITFAIIFLYLYYSFVLYYFICTFFIRTICRQKYAYLIPLSLTKFICLL